MDHSHLSEEQKRVLLEKGTEAPFSGEYYHHDEDGMYVCASCGEALFKSDNKYDSGSGWPSFDRPASEDAVAEEFDESHGMSRTEVLCSKCGGHLGHVFTDGPKETTGMRYCINSASLDFKEGE
jgi:peptide-methionine (R)-S-oxide reductase